MIAVFKYASIYKGISLIIPLSYTDIKYYME